MALGFSDPTKVKQQSLKQRNIMKAVKELADAKKRKSNARRKMANKSRATTFAVKRRS